jgi:transposase
MVNLETGEVLERRLYHTGKEVERFYGSLVGPTVVGIESTGYSIWFHELMEDLGIELKVGDAARIRAQQVRRKKNDREDARLSRKLLEEDRFPQIWVIDAEGRDLRQVLRRRRQLVKTRTGVKNSLQSLALNHRLALGSRLFTKAGREAFRKLSLRPYARQMATQLWEQLDWLQPRIRRLEKQIEGEAKRRPEAVLLQTHPGVGAITALAWVLIIGPVERFASAAQLAAYVGLVPTEHSSAGRRRLGHISKQGSTLMRYQLVEAANSASRHEVELRRFYRRLVARRGIQVAKTAVARKLSSRLYVMHRDGIEYTEFQRRGLLARLARNNS